MSFECAHGLDAARAYRESIATEMEKPGEVASHRVSGNSLPNMSHQKGASISITKSKSNNNGPLTGETADRQLFPDASEPSPIINPFDPDRIRIGTNYADLAAGRSANLTIPVWSRPPKASWFRAHP
jgi:hypothetical protein